MPDFQELLNKKASEVEPPKALPAGVYQFQIEKSEFGKSRQKQTPFVEFMCRATEPFEDVDDESLEEYGGLSDKSKLRITFYITEDSLFRLTNFFEHLGLEEGDKSINELIPDCPGQVFLGTVSHELSQDGETVYANISSTAPISYSFPST